MNFERLNVCFYNDWMRTKGMEIYKLPLSNINSTLAPFFLTAFDQTEFPSPFKKMCTITRSFVVLMVMSDTFSVSIKQYVLADINLFAINNAIIKYLFSVFNCYFTMHGNIFINSFICISVVDQTLLYLGNDMHIVYVVSVKKLPSKIISQSKNTSITLLSA